MTTLLDQISQFSKVVADTAEIEIIKKFKPVDATTNPSLILAACIQPEYSHFIDEIIQIERSNETFKELDELIDRVFDHLGRVSTEINPTLSYDTKGTVEKAYSLMKIYSKYGIKNERILIKIASTWEGIEAARILESNGIHCNMTLIFSVFQAIASAQAKATLISPFVGRVLDWQKQHSEKIEKDLGVELVKSICTALEGNPIEIMAASFRNIEQIQSLIGVDCITISPRLLEELIQINVENLKPRIIRDQNASNISMYGGISKENFEKELCVNVMASELLTKGIDQFSIDALKLKNIIKEKILQN